MSNLTMLFDVIISKYLHNGSIKNLKKDPKRYIQSLAVLFFPNSNITLDIRMSNLDIPVSNLDIRISIPTMLILQVLNLEIFNNQRVEIPSF